MEQNNQLMTLPTELAQIAENVTVEKRTEVQTVLNTVFSGVAKMRDQLNNVIVSDIDDKLNMKLANTIRLSVRQVRLEAEKTFDAKRAEVQHLMSSYKTEDALWLKAKQTMQILTKEIEENARWKEETRERYESEQRELKIQQRQVKLSAIASEVERSEFENMSDESFELFYSGLEKSYNEKIEADRIEEEKRLAKIKADEEERIRLNEENERLKKESLERERLADIERKKAAKEKADADARLEKEKKEREAIENKLRLERENAEAEKKRQDNLIEQARLEAERVRQEAETARIKKENEEKEKIRLEQLRIEEENERKLSASDADKVLQLIADIQGLTIPVMSSKEYKILMADVKTDLNQLVNKLKGK